MSGGSYNYLCHRDADDIFAYTGDLRDMANALTSRGYHDAAAETEAITAYIEHAKRQINARVERLTDLWKAVEWKESGDSGEDRVVEAISAYRNK